MTQFRYPVQVGPIAARVLAAELVRHAGPKTGLVVGVDPTSPVLAAAIDGLLPDDTLTLIPSTLIPGTLTPGAEPPEGTPVGALTAHVAAQGGWVADRIRVVKALGDAEPADIVVLAEPLSGTAEHTRAVLHELAKRTSPGGVLAVAVSATPLPNGAADEVERQVALFGVGSDLVLRNVAPVRVHRLRYTTADHVAAERIAPASRPSSVRLTRAMHIDSNGVAAAGIALGLAAVVKAARPKSRLWLVPALAAAPVAAFFRDPQRDVPAEPMAIVAASDGKVLAVERLTDNRFSAGDGELGDGEPAGYLRISVFLSVLDVHVNRAPVAGRVSEYFVEDGGYAAAMKPAAEHNVAAYTVLDTARGRVIVAQRTGLIARRIVQRVPVGSLLARGERMGLIRFGSRTDVYLPVDAATPAVAPGERVVGGVTVIARWLD